MNDTRTCAVDVRRLSRRFGSVAAVDDLTLAVPSGRIYGLLGSNGAGNSTLVKMPTTLLPPSAAEAFVAGESILDAPAEVRRRIGDVPKMLSADGMLTGRENLLFSARLYDIPAGEHSRRIVDALEFMQLEGAADRLVKTYSGGIRRLWAFQVCDWHTLTNGTVGGGEIDIPRIRGWVEAQGSADWGKCRDILHWQLVAERWRQRAEHLRATASPLRPHRRQRAAAAHHRSKPLTISSTACSGVSPRAIRVSSSLRSTLPMAASWVTFASGWNTRTIGMALACASPRTTSMQSTWPRAPRAWASVMPVISARARPSSTTRDLMSPRERSPRSTAASFTTMRSSPCPKIFVLSSARPSSSTSTR